MIVKGEFTIISMPEKKQNRRRKGHEFDFSYLYTSKNYKIVKRVTERLKEIGMKESELVTELGYSEYMSLSNIEFSYKNLIMIESILKIHIIG